MGISQGKSIRKKLIAAVSMLLVACVMLISASYAWFTLSTAPEISGITTTVGANGNLEIALADPSTWNNPDAIVTAPGTSLGEALSAEAKKLANITWGNLIDVSEVYGLEGVSLLPSRLSLISQNGKWAINEYPLLTPSYGTDGRVSQLLPNTKYAIFSTELTSSGQYIIPETMPHGVRIIGASTGMTDRQLAYRSAKANLTSAISQAKSSAKAALESNGTPLANIVMKKAIGTSPTFVAADIATLNSVLAGVSTAQQKMLTAWEAAVIAFAASNEGEKLSGLESEAAYMTFKSTMEAENGYTATVTADGVVLVVGSVSFTLPTELGSYYAKIKSIGTDIATAQAALEAITYTQPTGKQDEPTEPYATWEQIATPLGYIIKTDAVTVNGIASKEVKNKLNDLVASVTSGEGIKVQMGTGSGVFADIADYCGDYSAIVEIKGINYNGIVLGTDEKPVKATMTTKSTQNPSIFSIVSAAIAKAGAPVGTGDASNKLSDFYGYTLDFYLRTNAANANLLLQVDGAQRIYDDSVNEETMGSGSNMVFTLGDVNYTKDQMLQLMNALRVVFTDGAGEVIGVAVLDTWSTTKDGVTTPNYVTVDASTIKANLKLCNYTTVTTGSETTIQIDYVTNEQGQKVGVSFKDEQTLTALPQSQATKISATVYLDGDVVTNAMVANAVSSMTGTMNLQFATDVKLVPMDDTSLKGEVQSTQGSETN